MTQSTKYRKRPVEVEAVQWTGENIEEIHAFMAPSKPGYLSQFSNADELLGLKSGVAGVGDWVIRDPETQTFSHLSPDIFEATYEPAPLEENS